MNDTLTLRDLVGRTTDFFREKGISTARLDAELLLGHALDLTRLGVYLNLDRPISPAERDACRELVRRRAAREPVAYILGRRDFRQHTFRVRPGVLIPRPETEHLVEETLAELGDAPAPRLLEIGVGSGCVILSLLHALPAATADGTDPNPIALDVTRENAAALDADGPPAPIAPRVKLHQQSDLANLPPTGGARYDAIISNPPYIATTERESLPPDVARHEPAEALFAGSDGLDVYRMICAQAPPLLAPGGFIALEIGAGQQPALAELASQSNLQIVRVIKDLAGIERVLILRPCA